MHFYPLVNHKHRGPGRAANQLAKIANVRLTLCSALHVRPTHPGGEEACGQTCQKTSRASSLDLFGHTSPSCSVRTCGLSERAADESCNKETSVPTPSCRLDSSAAPPSTRSGKFVRRCLSTCVLMSAAFEVLTNSDVVLQWRLYISQKPSEILPKFEYSDSVASPNCSSIAVSLLANTTYTRRIFKSAGLLWRTIQHASYM